MRIHKNCFGILLILAFSCVYVYFFSSIYPKVFFITDYQNYLLVFSGEAEDTGFYPLFIALKEFFRFFNFDYSSFQRLAGISFVASNILFFRYLYTKVFRITLVEFVTACAFVLISFPFVKSFCLVKSFLSLSSLLIVFIISESCQLSRSLGFLLPLVPVLFSPICLPFVLLFHFSAIVKIRNLLFRLFKWQPSIIRFNQGRITLRWRILFTVACISGFLFIAVFFISRSIFFDQRGLTESLPGIYQLFVDKIFVYLGVDKFVFLVLAPLAFFAFLPPSIGILAVLFSYSALVGFGRVSIFIPFTVPFLCTLFPGYKLFHRIFLFVYMLFCVNKGLVLIGDL